MACEQMASQEWRNQLDAYIDGELAFADFQALGRHLRGCAELRSRIAKSVTAKSTAHARPDGSWAWKLLAVPAVLVLILSLGVNWYVGRENARRQRVYSELADLHVDALASGTPVDVLSTDRHTVKPWFQGKIPFTFNLPELQGTEFTLLGGRVTYLRQTPGAQLIFRTRQHDISAFIFPEASGAAAGLPSETGSQLSFDVETWEQNGLRYFLIGDVNHNDIRALSKLLRDAG